MKKIIIITLLCLFAHNTQSMDIVDYETVPLEEENQTKTIRSTQGLLIAAEQYKNEKNITGYDIKPIALTEYLCSDKNITSLEETQWFKSLSYCYREYPQYYQSTVMEVLEEIQQHQKSPALLEIHNQLKNLEYHNLITTEQNLKTLTSEYKKKKSTCLKASAPYAILGLIAVSELVGIALFGWVIDHCHHPWH